VVTGSLFTKSKTSQKESLQQEILQLNKSFRSWLFGAQQERSRNEKSNQSIQLVFKFAPCETYSEALNPLEEEFSVKNVKIYNNLQREEIFRSTSPEQDAAS